MPLRRVVIAVVTGAALVTAAAFGSYAFFAAPADGKSTEEVCFDPEGSIGWLIPACTALIASGRYHGSDLSGIYGVRGAAYRDTGDIKRAMADFDEMIRICPTAGAFVTRAALWEDQGDHDKAIADYTRAIADWPEWSPPYENRGEIYLSRGEPDRAVEDFTQAIRFGHPALINYRYIRRAVAYLAAGRYDDALLDVERVIEDEPDDALAWEVRGQIEAARGNLDAAIADFRTALGFEPSRKGALDGLKKLGASP